MASEIQVNVDTTEIDKATVKVQYLLNMIERLIELSTKSKLIAFLLGVKKHA